VSSTTPSLDNFYGLFQSHLLVGVLGLLEDYPPLRALMEGAGIYLLINFLLQPPSYYEDELTYIDREDGSTTLMVLHPTYVALLTVFYWWCHSFIEGNHIPPYSIWIHSSRVEFLCLLENVLWKAGDVPWFAFPIVGVLPRTLLKVITRPLVPVQPPPVPIEEISVFVGLVLNPSCSLAPAKCQPGY